MILIVGGRGFLAAHTRIALGDTPRILVSGAPPFDPELTSCERWLSPTEFSGDVGDDVLRNIDSVIYLSSASVPGDPLADMTREIELNVDPVARLLVRLIKINRTARFVYISSGGTVYGSTTGDGPVKEDHQLAPISLYGLGKTIVEGMIHFAGRSHRIPYSILRVANPVGPYTHSNRQGLVPAAFRAIRSGVKLKIFGDGTTERDYLSAADVGSAIVMAAGAVQFTNSVWNVGSGRGRSILEMIRLIGEATGSDVPFELASARPVDVSSIVLDSTRITSELGWYASGDISSVIKDMWSRNV